MELQPFDCNDYKAFADVVGTKPLICWPNDECYIIVDDEGICIGFDENSGIYILEVSYELAKRIVNGMDVIDLTIGALNSMGFRRID